MSDTSKRSKYFMITINNPTIHDDDEIELDNKFIYRIYQLEQGENETYHYQMCVCYENAKTIRSVSKIYTRAHIEHVKFIDKAIEYCSKEETRIDGPWEEGTKPSNKQGERNDLSQLFKDINNKMTYKEICQKYPNQIMRYYKGIKELKMNYTEDRNSKPTVVWIHGKAGIGKTKHVYSKFRDIFVKSANHKWWDGYDQQECILIDDFDHWHGGFKDLLRLLDRYPYMGETKGGMVKINSPYIYITSDSSPQDLFSSPFLINGEDNELAQIMRRINEVTSL